MTVVGSISGVPNGIDISVLSYLVGQVPESAPGESVVCEIKAETISLAIGIDYDEVRHSLARLQVGPTGAVWPGAIGAVDVAPEFGLVDGPEPLPSIVTAILPVAYRLVRAASGLD